MKIIRDALSLALVASSIIGVQILLNDRWLWSAAPSHAYGLIGFVAIDIVLVVAVLKKVSIGLVGAVIVAATQFGAMVADLAAGQPVGVPSVAFRAYLASDTSYTVLLAIQIAILTVAIGTLTEPLWHRLVRSTDLMHRARP
jgi:hypothetical protein